MTNALQPHRSQTGTGVGVEAENACKSFLCSFGAVHTQIQKKSLLTSIRGLLGGGLERLQGQEPSKLLCLWQSSSVVFQCDLAAGCFRPRLTFKANLGKCAVVFNVSSLVSDGGVNIPTGRLFMLFSDESLRPPYHAEFTLRVLSEWVQDKKLKTWKWGNF